MVDINRDSCIKCGKCVLVCPAGIMVQEVKDDQISLVYQDSCIACGHCVDVCPTDSVIHSLFPKEKQHIIDYSQQPTAEQVMLLIKSRRSNRAITSKQVPQEMLDQIIEAARYAPTASNKQQISVTAITDPEKLKQVSGFTIGVFNSVSKKLANPLIKLLLKPFLGDIYAQLPAFARLKVRHEAGLDPILRKATALLVFHTPKSNRFGCEDANLAYQNASLMAQSLGVSQIYMGFVLGAMKQDGVEKFSKIIEVDGRVYAIMALGMPAFKYLKYTDR